jgi:hypothetical protein
MHATRHETWQHAAAAALLLLVGSPSCGHTTASQPAAVAAPVPAKGAKERPRAASNRVPLTAPPPPASAALGDVMGDHFLITSWARDSVIAGTLDPMRAPLTSLANYRYDEVRTGGWMPWIAQLQEAARLTSNAATLDTAAMGVATMGRVCGECHRASHGGPTLPPPPERADHYAHDTVDERMGRHMWASELLWEGLTGPSDVSWEAGAKRLVDAPDELADELPTAFAEDLNEVKRIGQDASEAHTLSERANVYGMLIATCADCHTRWIEHGEP